jgi:leader peptidase (prepilin peptidase)/N-methyltransferase
LIELYIILIGLAISSFLGSLSYRVPRKISILTPPSFCPSCRRRLRAFELVPVASYIALRGRCRTCGYRIPVQFLIIEILTPLLFFALYRRIGINPILFTYGYLVSLLLYLSLVDIDTGSVSAGDIGAIYAGGLFMLFLSYRGVTAQRPLQSLYGFGLCLGLLSLSLLIIYIIRRRRALGIGDILILPGIALYFGLYSIIRILLFSSIVGLAFGVVLIILKKVDSTFKFPMIPFLTVGVCIEILAFYSTIQV